ncbi:MAG: efflux RND transporter periplasmic adaptor subunit, partial [Oscillospiraceae bacterium]|nr:efflux RND transporter periplasmic adaptor subunit [Oscillospiraceae bacterium]
QAIVTNYESQQAGTSGGVTDIASLEEAVSQQQRNLQTLILTLAEKKQEDTLTQQINELELKSQQNAIDKQKKELEKLRKDTGAQTITSKNDGIVSVISCAAGDTVMDGDTLASLTLTNSGYTAQFSVTAEQARKLRAGITAEITNQYYSDVTAKLTAIRPDTENPKSTNKLLIFDITGSDVSVGQSLALSISCSSQNYDCVVPSSAIMEDNDGKFVLLLKSKSTPLGNRYYASRCDVTVLAQDEINSAVQGDMNSSDFVITNSEKPLTAGTQVRMEEN